jgi:UDP-4-amino-4,6-dideoxy-N-acetyl-beta-L-altrosamine transaminase
MSEPFLPYGRQQVDEADVAAVAEVLRSAFLTTGPAVERFEAAVGAVTGAPHAVAVSSGTAALHAMLAAAGVGPGDEVIVPALTFAATANAALYCGATPVIADVDPDTLLLGPVQAAERISPRTRAIVAVDYAGQPADYPALRTLAGAQGAWLFADGAHALGGALDGVPVGALADATVFSFHPVKHVTTGEGGMVVTADESLAGRARRFRNHGIDADHRQRSAQGTWVYEMVDLGYNYRLSDIACALGTSQLAHLPGWVARRRALAARYEGALAALPAVRPVAVRPGAEHAYHLYPVRVPAAARARVFEAMRATGIGVNVHYLPVHLHAYYRERFGTGRGLCPAAEAAYDELLTLPLFPAMTDADVDRVVEALGGALREAGA